MAASRDSIAELCEDQHLCKTLGLSSGLSPKMVVGFLLLFQTSHPGLRHEEGRET